MSDQIDWREATSNLRTLYDENEEEQPAFDAEFDRLKTLWTKDYMAEFTRFAKAIGWDHATADEVGRELCEVCIESFDAITEGRQPEPMARKDVADSEIEGVKIVIAEAALSLGVPNPIDDFIASHA